MKPSKFLGITLVMIFVLLMFRQFPPARSELTSVEDKALAYIKNVLPVDMSMYTIKSRGVYEPTAIPNSRTHTESVSFTLTSNYGNQLFANCMYHDEVQYSCTFQVMSGSMISDKPYSNLAEESRSILERHQSQTGVDTTKLTKMLDALNLTARVQIVTWGNLELGVSSSRLVTGLKMVNGELHVDSTTTIGVTSFCWNLKYANGTRATYFFIDFANGIFHSLQDWHTIGDIETDGSTITISQLDQTSLDNTATANSAQADNEPPQISNLSVKNKSYSSAEIPVEFSINENVSRIVYCLDNQANVTISGNATLSGLSNGSHNIILYATDYSGNVGASENVIFTVTMETQQTGSEQKEQKPAQLNSIAIALGITVLIAGVGLLLYFKKRTRKQQ